MSYADIRTNKFYYEKDPQKKGLAWANELVTLMRQNWSPLVTKERAKKGMQLLMSTQGMDDVIKSFKDGSAFMSSYKDEIVPVAVFERIKNILVSEYKKGSYMPQVNAVDPAAESERKRDMTMLKNRKFLEGPMSNLNRRMGLPPYKMPKDKFSSNVDQFDEMGLDENNPQDLSFFRQVYQRLDHEIAATEVVQALYKYNDFDLYIEDLVCDILAKKAIAFQQYESRTTGEFKWQRLEPENVRWIKGSRRDGKDAVCLGYERLITVKEFRERAAGYFDFDIPEHRNMLLQAIQTCNVTPDWHSLTYQGAMNAEGECVSGWSQINTMNVQIGYIEWKTVNGSARKVNPNTGISYQIGYGEEVSKNSVYKKIYSDDIQKTYKTYFVATSTWSHYLWDMGELYHQMREGADDEYSTYSLSVWTGTGKTAMEISEPLLKVANYAFYKLVWGIFESRPNVEVYNVDTLYNLLGKLGGDSVANTFAGTEAGRGAPPTSGRSIDELTNLISFMRKSLTRIYSTEGMERMGGDGKPHYVEPGGLDPIAVAMQTVVDWAEAKIMSQLGINALREGYTPDPKDGYKLNMEATNQSRNATYYISDAIAFVMAKTATNSIILAQDVIAYGGKGKNFLLRLVGSDNIEILKSLNRIPLHRYGMFVDVYNASQRRQEIAMEGQVAWTKGDIQYHEYLLIKEIPDYKKAAMTLAFFRERGERIKRQQEELAHKRAMELEQAKTQGEIAIKNVEGQWRVKERETWGEYYMAAYTNAGEITLKKKQLDNDSIPAKSDAKIKEIREKAQADASQPLPAAPVESEDQQKGAAQEQ